MKKKREDGRQGTAETTFNEKLLRGSRGRFSRKESPWSPEANILIECEWAADLTKFCDYIIYQRIRGAMKLLN
jgi:hypothetical protein